MYKRCIIYVNNKTFISVVDVRGPTPYPAQKFRTKPKWQEARVRASFII